MLSNTKLIWISKANKVPTNCLSPFKCTKTSLPLELFNKSKGLSILLTIKFLQFLLFKFFGVGIFNSFNHVLTFVCLLFKDFVNKKLFKLNLSHLTMTTKKGRKISGGKYTKNRKKKSYERTGQKRIVKLGEEKKREKRVMGGNKKIFLLKVKFVNIQAKGKKIKTEIKNVLTTPSNRFLARQNIITKGAILETKLGNVRVTNRPSQEGMINGILVE